MKNNKELSRTRSKKFQIYLGEEEMKLLTEKAKGFGLSKSDYMRSLIVHGSVRQQSIFSDEQFQLFLNEMNHIGVNLNQITYRVNAARNADREDFNALRQEFENLLNLYRLWASPFDSFE